MQRLKVLVLSRNYPNESTPNLGLWVERLVRHTITNCEARVIAPVPYCPPLPGLPEYTRFRQVQRQRDSDGIKVYHPRFLVGFGYSLYNVEALSYYLGIRGVVERVRREFPFDLIHAHFGYPDGVVASRLGSRYRVPVVVTEHALWRPWMDRHRLVRQQVVSASSNFAFHIAVSQTGRDTITHFTGRDDRIRVIPVGVDGSVFRPDASGNGYDPNQVLFVGFINFNKGVDILLQAMQKVSERRPDARLVLVGGSIYRDARLQEERLRRMADELGIGERVTFVGRKSAAEVARYMCESAMLVLPSRRESFGAVLVEALACGTPVVASRCGGPEDIVNEKVGLLFPNEDVNALASAIEQVLQQRHKYDPVKLRAHALENFSWERVANYTTELYQEALRQFHDLSDRQSSAAQ